MRDKRFVAAHRGGLLPLADHQLLAAWAADCAEHLLPLFERFSSDGRPRQAIEVGRAWARGEVRTGVAQRAAVAAHAAARCEKHEVAVAVARAAGHAVATAHAADHSVGVLIYGAKAVTAAGGSAEDEQAWHLARLPSRLRTLVISAMRKRQPRRDRREPACRAGVASQSCTPRAAGTGR
jgi:hypothetical protein